MKRNEFLKRSLEVLGVAMVIPFSQTCSKKDDPTAATSSTTATATTTNGASSTECIAAPTETAGPFPKDLSALSAMFRKDITEGKTGLPLNLTITVVNVNDSCKTVENARVDIWHCDKDGYYSEYSEPGYLGVQNYTGKTFLRGIQLTDLAGIVTFNTIYPGWYSGRIAHIHFEVFANSVLKKTTQMAFPDEVNAAVYKTDLYKTHGQNTSVANNKADMVFGDSEEDLDHELCTITANATTGGYDAQFTIGISL